MPAPVRDISLQRELLEAVDLLEVAWEFLVLEEGVCALKWVVVSWYVLDPFFSGQMAIQEPRCLIPLQVAVVPLVDQRAT